MNGSASSPVDPEAALGAVLTTPPPAVSAAEAEAIGRDGFGIAVRAAALPGERDRNFLLTSADGGRHVLKIANPAEPVAVTDLQTRALLHVAAVDPGLPVPRVVPTRDGAPMLHHRAGVVRVLTYLTGEPIVEAGPALRTAVARAAARLARALAGFDHPAADHRLLWDVANAARLAPLVAAIPDGEARQLAEGALAAFASEIAPRLADCPRQVVHNDFNPHNLLVDPAAPDRLAGILDFGDLVRTQRVADLAVAAAYHLADEADPVARIAAFAADYHALHPLTREESDLLVDLVAARLATTLAVAGWRAARRPADAAYILRNVPAARTGLARLAGVDRAAAARRIANACGLPETTS